MGYAALPVEVAASALAIQEGVPPRRVPVNWLRETLVDHGAYLGPNTLSPAGRGTG